MSKNNSFENTGLLNRIKESSIFFIFIIISAVISLIIIDLIVFPIALFAIKNKELYTRIIIHLLWLSSSLFFILLLIKKLRFLKKIELTNYQIIKYILIKPFLIFTTTLIIIILILVLVAILYIILQNNYYILYSITNL